MATPGIRMLTGGDLALPDGHRALPPQPRALFVVLLLNVGTEVSRDWLADLLWPETDQQTARRRLRTTLLNLKTALEGVDWSRIEATREVARLDVDPRGIDVYRFERAASSDHSETRAMACDFYTGDLLAHFPAISDEFDRFLEARRAAFRSTALSLLLEKLQAAHDRSDASGFDRAYGKLVHIDPVNEAAVRLAMAAWSETGKDERIETEFRRFRVAYADAYDAPLPEAVAAAYRSAVKAAGRAPAPAHRQPKDHKPPLRREDAHAPSRRLRTAPVILLVLACLAGLAWAIRALSPFPPGPVVLLSAAELIEEGCTIAEVAARYRQEIRDGLEAIEGASLVVGPIGRALARSGDATFELRQSATCRGNSLRATLTLSRPEAAQAVWIGRFDASASDLDDLSSRVQTDLGSVLIGGFD